MIEGLRAYAAYKDSGVEWLGAVPKHWNVVPNRALFLESKESDPDEQMLSVTIGKGIIAQKELLADSSKKDSSRQDRSAYKLARPGDVVYNKMRAWQGAIGVSKYRGIVSPAYIVMRPRLPGNASYFHNLFRTPAFAEEARRWSYGIASDMWSLRSEHFKAIYSCVPPVSEQAAILRFLNHADERIRRYIRAKQKLIQLLDEEKQAVVHRAVTRGVDLNVRLKPSGVAWLGEIPEHWEIRRAKAVCSGIIDCKNRTPEQVDGGEYLVVRTTCVRDGQFDPSGGYLTDHKNYSVWTARGTPSSGDVFFTREAPAGEACLVPDRHDLCMGQRMMYFRPDPGLIDSRFLLLGLYGPLTRKYIELATNGSTVGHLRLGQVYSLPVLWCPVSEQVIIVQHVEQVTREIERLKLLARNEISLLLEFRTRLIADVVTGKLDVRVASAKLPEETAEVEPLDETEDLPQDEDATDGKELEAAEDA